MMGSDGMIVLDDDQKSVIRACPNEPLLIIAPPGAGKTTVMAKRIEYLLELGAIKKPFKVLGLTFSNSAANEMKKKVLEHLPQYKDIIFITNFHSFCFGLLRSYGNLIGINTNFAILTEKESDRIINKLLRKHDLPLDSKYKNWKTNYILGFNFDKDQDSQFIEIFNDYIEEINKIDSLDYDCLLYYVFQIFTRFPEILEYYRNVFRYILVDEFQDTNLLQFKILELLLMSYKKFRQFDDPGVFILADPNQAIYEFQGSDIGNIDRSVERFFCRIEKLQKDYRSESEGIKILKKQISFFLENSKIDDRPENPVDKPSYCIYENRLSEATNLSGEIKKLIESGVHSHQIALLLPNQFYFSEIRNSLNDEDIDFIFVPDFKGTKIINKYQRVFRSLKNCVNEEESSFSSKFELICEEKVSNYLDNDILNSLLEISKKYDIFPHESLSFNEKTQLFLNEICLEVDWGNELRKRVKNKIFVSSIHGSKGLEFDYVFVSGLNRNSLPHKEFCDQCQGDGLDYDNWMKNLKILNVATSRAKKNLFLTSVDTGSIHKTCLLVPFYDYLSKNEV
jgi:DNA helicase-2/ATP-dependent DNA helicase PcrA